MKTAVTYMRMSTDRQEYSIDSQERLIRSYAKQNHFSILRDYIDAGISGRTAEKRPQFLQMIEDSAKGEFDYVLIYDSSRFARNLEQSLVYKSILKRNGVALISITEPVLDDDTSLITDALFGAMNEMYSRKLSKNVKRGLEQKALRGEFCGSEPFGYDYDKATKMLIPNPREAPVVKYIMQEALSGRTAYSIATEMGRRNIRTKAGVTLDRRRVDYIMTNPVYIGYIRWSCDGRQIVQKSTHQPLIREDTFHEIQRIIQERTARRQKNEKPAEKRFHWLSGKIYCSECNCVYCYVKAKERGNKKARFRCSGQSRGRCSSGISFRADLLEQQVISILQEVLEDEDVLYRMNLRKKEVPHADYESDLKKLTSALDRAKKAFLAGVDTIAEYGENKRTILAEIEKIKQQQAQQSSKKINIEAFRVRLAGLIELLNGDASLSEKKEAFHSIVERLVIDKQTKNISFYFFA